MLLKLVSAEINLVHAKNERVGSFGSGVSARRRTTSE